MRAKQATRQVKREMVEGAKVVGYILLGLGMVALFTGLIMLPIMMSFPGRDENETLLGSSTAEPQWLLLYLLYLAAFLVGRVVWLVRRGG